MVVYKILQISGSDSAPVSQRAILSYVELSHETDKTRAVMALKRMIGITLFCCLGSYELNNLFSITFTNPSLFASSASCFFMISSNSSHHLPILCWSKFSFASSLSMNVNNDSARLFNCGDQTTF
jgi:hypothetical protein